MKRKLEDCVVVITGASSGIGKAAALEFARHQSTLILIARESKALKQAAEECRESGAPQAAAIAADVTDEKAVKNAARQAIETFGKIDVWVNNAAVTLFSRFEEAPYDAYRQVIETNLFGCIHGARAVLPYFREQGRGVLINLSSMTGKAGSPYVSAYAASKFAINGLAESLRMELRDAPDIHVCTVLASSIDTPLFQHAANYSGRAVKPLEPVYSAEKVAKAILRLAVKPRREAAVGSAGRMLTAMRYTAPRLAERLQAEKVDKNHFQEISAASSKGNLFQPMEEWDKVSGGWRKADGHGKPAGKRLALVPSVLLLGTGIWAVRKLRSKCRP